jgi:hypothetical protein
VWLGWIAMMTGIPSRSGATRQAGSTRASTTGSNSWSAAFTLAWLFILMRSERSRSQHYLLDGRRRTAVEPDHDP